MNAVEVMYTTWVGWPIYAGFAFLIGIAIWERYDEKSRKSKK